MYKVIKEDGALYLNVDGTLYGKGSPEYMVAIKKVVSGEETIEGPDVKTGDYLEQRVNQYPNLAEQLDMLFWDMDNDSTPWRDAIRAIKEATPKTLSESV